MTFPTTQLLDNFNRSDIAALPSPWASWWSPGNTFENFNQHADFLIPGTATDYRSNATYGPDCEVWCTIAQVSSGGGNITIWLRGDNGGASVSGYGLELTVSGGVATFKIGVYNATNPGPQGTFGTTLASTTQAFANGDGVGFSAIGTTLTAWYRSGASGAWTAILTTTDSTYTAAGRLAMTGVLASGTNWQIEDFGGGTFGTVPQHTPTGPSVGCGDRLALEDGSGVVLLEYTALLTETDGDIALETPADGSGGGVLLFEWGIDSRMLVENPDPWGIMLEDRSGFLQAESGGTVILEEATVVDGLQLESGVGNLEAEDGRTIRLEEMPRGHVLLEDSSGALIEEDGSSYILLDQAPDSSDACDGMLLEDGSGYIQLNNPRPSPTDAILVNNRVISGTASITQPAASLDAVGTVPVTGTADVTQPAASLDAVAVERFTATGSVTQPAASLDATAKERFTATADVTQPAASLDATAKERFTATASVTQPPASLDAVAKERFTASADVTQPAASLDAVAKEKFVATASVTQPAASLDATAKERFVASGSVTESPASLDASGTVTETGVVGDGSVTQPAASLDAMGSVTVTNVTGTASVTQPAASLDMNGSVTNPPSPPKVVSNGPGGAYPLKPRRRPDWLDQVEREPQTKTKKTAAVLLELGVL
jgi:hypothetical protein